VPQVLTTNAQIFCPHGGKGTTIPAHPKWTVNGGYVSVEGDIGVLACLFLPLPCIGYQLKSMGLNATQIDGERVILVTDFNQSFTGLPLVMAESHPVYDDSTVAGIPAGQSAPPPSAELADLLPPIVALPIPSSVPFSISTTTAPVTIGFTLTTTHPLRWILTLLNTTLGQHIDLTNGAPGADVSPSGGDWNSVMQTVVVTFNPAFMAALTAGTHYLFMTGVSKRGLNGHSSATLNVTP
jgi:hypothetical protein